MNVEEATKISNKFRESLIKNIEYLGYVAIQIKSHDFTNSYFKPKGIMSGIASGRGFGWQRKGQFKEKIPEAEGLGPKGYCVCEKCSYKIKHKRGTPCSTIKCPKCNIPLKREQIS